MQYLFAMLVFMVVLQPAISLAQSGKPAPNPSGNRDEKLDVTDLEKKYWASKDTEFNVVQNRLYSKAHRFNLGLGYGSTISESWADGPTLNGTLGYYFSERWGVELAYSKTDSKDNKDVQRLKSQSGYPNHNLIKDFYGAQVNWVPFYAKMSFLNSAIVYFDMGISIGAGMISYEQMRKEAGPVEKSAPALTLDITQQFFLNKWLAVRADFKNRFFNQEILWYDPLSNPGNRVDSTGLTNFQIITLGLNFYF